MRMWPRPTTGRNDWAWIGRSCCGMRCGAISPISLTDYGVAGYAEHPLSHDQTSLANIADWGTAEEWSDWAQATG